MKKKSTFTLSIPEAPPRRRGRPPKVAEEVRVQPEAGSQNEDDAFSPNDLLSLADLRSTNEPDPREIDSLTDRIFGSVLSRYGWEFENGHIEHVGEEARR